MSDIIYPSASMTQINPNSSELLVNSDENNENGKSNTTIPIKLGNVVTAIFNKNINIDLTQSECILNDDDIITNLINKVNVNPITVSHNDPRVEILSDNQTSEDINKLLNS